MTQDAKEFLKRYLEEEGANTEEKKPNPTDGTPNEETPKKETETNVAPTSNDSNGNVDSTNAKEAPQEKNVPTESKETNPTDGTPNEETPKKETETNTPPTSNNPNGNVKSTTGEAKNKQEEVSKESAESNGEKNNQNTEDSSSAKGLDIKNICSKIVNSFGKQTINGTDLVLTPISYSSPVDNGDGTKTYSVQFSIMKPKDSFGTKVGKALDAIGLNLSNFSPYGNTNKTSNQSYTKSVL